MLKRFGLGFAAGYVLGARAGEQRYEQLAAATRKLVELPGVRDLVGRSQETVMGSGRDLLDRMRDRFGLDGQDDGEQDHTEDEGMSDEVEPEQAQVQEDEQAEDRDAEEDVADQSEVEEEAGDEADAGRADADQAGAAAAKPRPHRLADLASAAFERGRVA